MTLGLAGYNTMLTVGVHVRVPRFETVSSSGPLQICARPLVSSSACGLPAKRRRTRANDPGDEGQDWQGSKFRKSSG